MTQKQIDTMKKTLPHRDDYKTWTPEQKRLDKELACREMINSCLTYGFIQDFWMEHEWWFEDDKSYAAPYIRALGMERVRELVKEQKADFAKAKVIHGMYTDREDCTYNTVIWPDDEAPRAPA